MCLPGQYRCCVLGLRKERSHVQASPCWGCCCRACLWDVNRHLKLADAEPDDTWRIAAQRAAQQLRACGGSAAPSTASGPAPALAPEERKLMALETIAEAARLWIQLNKPEDEDEENV
ncbi:hypothetical protein HRG_012495 [Hirsutella rhossiliensis]